MKVYYDSKLESPLIRSHPWVISLHDASHKYYDFKRNPNFIPEVLEDFKPWDKYEAIRLFYEFLAWLNGKSSPFESNDSAFMGPGKNNDALFPKKLKCSGRIMMFYRNLSYNLSDEYMDWLRDAFFFYLERLDPSLEFGCIGLTFQKTDYRALSNKGEEKLGKLLQLSWWAYGDSEEDTMENLKRVFLVLFEALKSISDEINEEETRQSIGNV